MEQKMEIKISNVTLNATESRFENARKNTRLKIVLCSSMFQTFYCYHHEILWYNEHLAIIVVLIDIHRKRLFKIAVSIFESHIFLL